MPKNTINIRLATTDDAQSIRQVQHDAWIATYPNKEQGITLEAIRQRVSKYLTAEYIQKLKVLMADPKHCSWVAMDRFGIVGYSTAMRHAEANHLQAIYVLPAYHGLDVGGQLIQSALAWLGNEKNIHVEVASYNGRAIRFYEKHGFRKNGEEGFNQNIPTIELVRKVLAKNHT